MLLSIVAIILVFGAIIFVHELGHMLAAKSCGVAVPDFSIGLGPSLLQARIGGTRYHLSALPIGGYASIAGLAHDVADAPGARDDHVSYPFHATWQAKNGFQRAWMLAAGPLMNLLLAFVVVIVAGFVGFPSNAVLIDQVEPGMPAAEAGIEAGDIVLALDGRDITGVEEFASIVQQRAGTAIDVRVQRGQEQRVLSVVPRVIEGFNEGRASIGVALGEIYYTSTVIALVMPRTAGYESGLRPGDVVTHVNGEPITNGYELLFGLADMDENFNPIDDAGNLLGPEDGKPVSISVQRRGEQQEITLPGNTTIVSLGVQFKPRLERLPPVESLVRSLHSAGEMTLGLLFSLRMLFTEAGLRSVTGPVGIMAIIGQSVHGGLHSFLQIVILINLWLALVNLLPLPALDGGRLVFVALDGVGLRVSERRQAMVHAIGIVMLLGLIGLITFTDILALL